LQNEADCGTFFAMLLDLERLRGEAILAPMAGFGDAVFRSLCRAEGAALVVTEMVSAEGILRGARRTWELAEFGEEERPVLIQLFGSDPGRVAEAAERILSLRPDGIDLNFGCPIPKVVRRGEGAALLRDLARMEGIAREVVRAVPVPVTAKIRSGWSAAEIVAVEAAQRLEQAGVAAVTIHPRTREQRFAGKADWSLIKEAKKSVRIPVIGNGDVRGAEDALRMLEETGCDLVMIGRGALGRPWIFRQVRHLRQGAPVRDPLPRDRVRAAVRHLELCAARYGDPRGLRIAKPHLSSYLKGLPGASQVKDRLFRAASAREAIDYLQEYEERLTHGQRSPGEAGG